MCALFLLKNIQQHFLYQFISLTLTKFNCHIVYHVVYLYLSSDLLSHPIYNLYFKKTVSCEICFSLVHIMYILFFQCIKNVCNQLAYKSGIFNKFSPNSTFSASIK
jgi:hypothetical protein